MSADELRGTSPHVGQGNIFGVNRRQWKAVPVKSYTPRKMPFSIKFMGFLGKLISIMGVSFAVASAVIFYQGKGLDAGIGATYGFSMIVTGTLLVASCHVAKAVLNIRDMTAHRHLGE